MRYYGSGSILKSIQEEIKSFNSREGRIATFIIINEVDTVKLRHEMIQSKILPDGVEMAFQIQGLRVIRTKDISQGMFVVTGE